MKVLVVGGGGREHAIIKKLKQSPKITKLYAAPGNGGISKDAQCIPVKATDIPNMINLVTEKAIDFVVVAPDDPLVLGMADALREKGIPCFGPDKAAAQIEGSKVFSKALMKKYGIPTAAYESFDNPVAAKKYADNLSYPVWIKTDGLALGKGAVMADSVAEAYRILDSLMVEKTFGDSGSKVVIEEHMTGPEVTVLAFTDGKTVVPMVSSMDHKRALDGDKGLNTGGMGTIAPNPCYNAEDAAICMEKIFIPTIRAMEKEGCPFCGCLYFGLMLTSQGPKVIEYNCRFGDPEAQVVLELLETDLLEIMEAVEAQKLSDLEIRWKNGHAACIIMASGGYPEAYQTNLPISGLDENGGLSDAVVHHAGTKFEDNTFFTAGGRVLGITASAESLDLALKKAYTCTKKIHFQSAHYRTDIGSPA